MADDISKKILVEINVKSDDAAAAVNNFKSSVDASGQSVDNLNEKILEAKAAQAQYSAELSKGKVDQQAVKTATDQFKLSVLQANQAQKEAKKSVEAASGSYNEASQKLAALGRAIKSVQDGFKSSDPAIQKQIQEYKQLNTELKAFDSKLGNHQRNVGGYSEALSGLTSQLGSLIPGFSKFSSILQTAAQGFNGMGSSATSSAAAIGETGEAAEGAEAGVAGLGIAAGLLVGVIAAVIGVVAGLINYLKDIAPVSDKVSNVWAGMKATFTSFMNDVRDGDWSNMISNMSDADTAARQLNQAMTDLNRTMVASEVDTNKENEFIATQMLKMRNIHTTAAQAEEIFSNIQETAQKQYQRVNSEAVAGFNIVAHQIQLTAKLNNDELRLLARDGVSYAETLKAEGKHISDDLITDLAKYQNARISSEGIRDQIEQRAQNREDQRIAKNTAAADKSASELAEAQRALDEANNEHQQSIARTLQSQMEAYAKELSMNAEHFRQMLFKEEDFIKKQQELESKTKSPAVKAKAAEAIKAAKAAKVQITEEYNATSLKLIQDHNITIAQETQKANDELRTMQIASLIDDEEREKQTNSLSEKEKLQAITDSNTAINLKITQLDNQLKSKKQKLSAEETKSLKDELAHQNELLLINKDKATEIVLATQKAETDIKKKYADERLKNLDEASVINTDKDGTDPNAEKHQQALQTQLADEFMAKIQNENLTNDQLLLLEAKYLSDKKKLEQQYNAQKYDQAIKYEQMVQTAASTIIQNAIRSNAQATEVGLQNAQRNELKNTALTTTQKDIIEEKYRIKSGQAKVKEFEANKKLQLANAIINLMVAEGRLWVDPGFPAAIPMAIELAAQSTVQIATIAAQKPPAYARGGIHYNSDGKGGVLPGYSKTDNTNAFLRSGEGVVVSEAMRDPHARKAVSDINVAYGGRSFASSLQVNPYSYSKPAFASGGVYMPTTDNGLRPTQIVSQSFGRLHPEDIQSIANAVASMPPPYVVADIKDVNNAQQILSNNQARVRI